MYHNYECVFLLVMEVSCCLGVHLLTLIIYCVVSFLNN